LTLSAPRGYVSDIMQKAPAAKKTKTAKPIKTAKAFKAAHKLEHLKSVTLKTDLPQFKAGDKVVVKSKIKEGDKERVQAFEGTVIAINGRGVTKAFTVRKVSSGVGVERVYPLHSPNIVSLEVVMEGFVRRAKLYHLRGLEGRSARIQDKNLKLKDAAAASVEKTPSAT
jgi:large subunit ribosomal protein L19